MKNRQKGLVGVLAVIAILLMTGWIICLCKITTLNAEGIQRFATIIDIVCSLGILLLTAANVWLAYTVSNIEEKHRKYQLQTEILNRCNSNIHAVFIYEIDGGATCKVQTKNLHLANEWFKYIKKHADLLPILGSEDYERFLQKFNKLCTEYASYGPSEELGNMSIEQLAFDVYNEAEKISFKLLDDVVSFS